MPQRRKKERKTEPAYLTKRILVRAAKAGINHAARETMKIMGYTVIASDGWVVKKFNDGTIERLSPIPMEHRPQHIVLK